MSFALPLGFLLGFFGSVPVAGPIALMVVAYGVSNRVRSGLFLAAGGACAESFYAFVAFWGFAELVRRYALFVSLANGAAAVLLIGLGCWFFVHRPGKRTQPSSLQRETSSGGKFLLGFTITALNPTLLITWTGAVTTLSSFRGGWLTPTHALSFAVGTFGGIVSWFALLLGGIHRYQARLPTRALSRIVQGAGVLLIALGIWFATRLITHLAG